MSRRKAGERAAYDALMGDESPQVNIPVEAPTAENEAGRMAKEAGTQGSARTTDRISRGRMEDLRVPNSLSVESCFERSSEHLEAARGHFGSGLEGLTGQLLQRDQLRDTVARVTALAESLFLALKLESGPIVSLSFEEANGCLELKPLGKRRPLLHKDAWPKLVAVPIETLPGKEGASVLGVSTGRRLAANLSPELRSRGGLLGNSRMSAEEKSDRGRQGGKAAAEAMTPAERSERARLAVQARWARVRRETE